MRGGGAESGRGGILLVVAQAQAQGEGFREPPVVLQEEPALTPGGTGKRVGAHLAEIHTGPEPVGSEVQSQGVGGLPGLRRSESGCAHGAGLHVECLDEIRPRRPPVREADGLVPARALEARGLGPQGSQRPLLGVVRQPVHPERAPGAGGRGVVSAVIRHDGVEQPVRPQGPGDAEGRVETVTGRTRAPGSRAPEGLGLALEDVAASVRGGAEGGRSRLVGRGSARHDLDLGQALKLDGRRAGARPTQVQAVHAQVPRGRGRPGREVRQGAEAALPQGQGAELGFREAGNQGGSRGLRGGIRCLHVHHHPRLHGDEFDGQLGIGARVDAEARDPLGAVALGRHAQRAGAGFDPEEAEGAIRSADEADLPLGAVLLECEPRPRNGRAIGGPHGALQAPGRECLGGQGDREEEGWARSGPETHQPSSASSVSPASRIRAGGVQRGGIR